MDSLLLHDSMAAAENVDECLGLHDSFNLSSSSRDVNDLTDIPELIPDAKGGDDEDAMDAEEVEGPSETAKPEEVIVFDREVGAIPQSVKALWDAQEQQRTKAREMSMCNGHKRELPPIRNYSSVERQVQTS